MSSPSVATDLALKRTVHAPVEQKPHYAWRDILSGESIEVPNVILICPHGEERFALAEVAAAVVARNILEYGLAPGELINVNVPAVPPDEFGGFEVTRLGKRVYQDHLVERRDPRGIPYFWIGGPPPSGLAIEGTDFHAIVNRRVAITPIHLDLTGRRLLRRLRTWRWELPDRDGASPEP